VTQHTPPPNVSVYDFKHADWTAITSYLNDINFYDLFACCDSADSVVSSFYAVIYEAFNRFIPVRKVSNQRSSKYHYPFKVRRLLHKKATAWQVYRNFRTPESLIAYKSITSQCRQAIHSYHATLEDKIISSGNINKFYRYANRKFSSRSPVGPLKQTNGSLIIDPARKADLLQSVFSSMFTTDNGHIPPLTASINPNDKLCNVYFSTNLVKNAIKKLRANSKGGPDGLPPVFLKTCSSQLSTPLAYIYNQCMEQGYLAPDWLRAYITPVFKKGDATNPLNYRPIALTCTICKIMESVIKDQLLNYLLHKKLITKHQHGFLNKRSTATNLLECTQDWIVALSNHHCVDVIYIDFSRAFDSIVFTKLIAKLKNCGIDGKLLAWLTGFLHNRTQCVVLENCFSSEATVNSGVIQGSVLGPILFLIYINDVAAACNDIVRVKLFADDVKLYSIIDTSCSTTSLQQSIDSLASWASSWQLSINISKCSVLSLRNRTESFVSLPYYVNGVCLTNSSLVSDLGVLVDSKLAYNQHISSIISKATQRAGVFFRGFTSRNLALIRKTYVTYIRPILEYNSTVWNPTKKYLIDQLENVQRRYTKRVPSLSHLSYLERLSILNLEPLEIRRLKYDLTLYYKILHNLTCISPSQYFEHYQPTRCLRTVAEGPVLRKPFTFSSHLLSSFFYRCIDCWNHLPPKATQASSVYDFKKSISEIDLTNYLKGGAFQ
jgi:hypothetical protein